ncbi:MAG: RHS repeat-associated core domain-containing protein [Archangium sp.]|nr:RHS repeat-associated core domain-containing protein [Archangium sp.]
MCCGPNGPPGGPPGDSPGPPGPGDKVGDPITLAGQSAWLETLDLTVDLPVDKIWLKRTYASTDTTWNIGLGANAAFYVPKPFGRYSRDESLTRSRMVWVHNFFSYVLDEGNSLSVNTPWQSAAYFNDCTPSGAPCVTTKDDRWFPERLMHLDTGGFVLIGPQGSRHYYETSAAFRSGKTHWFLTRQTDKEGRPLTVIAYGDGGTCPGVSDSGVPYVTTVMAADGGPGLRFNYVALRVADTTTGERDCVVSSVDVIKPNGTVGATVLYSYAGDDAGLLSGVSGGFTDESYTYGNGFGVLRSGSYVSFHPLFDANQDAGLEATGDFYAGRDFSLDGGNAVETVSSLGICSPGNGSFSRTAVFHGETAGDGTGQTTDPGFTSRFSMLQPGTATGGHSNEVLAKTDSCTSSLTCSAGVELYGWRDSNNGPSCGNGRLAALRNELGNWFVEDHEFLAPDAGPFGAQSCNPTIVNAPGLCTWERQEFKRGVSPSVTSTNALETNSASYGYTADFSVQYPRKETRPSVLDSSTAYTEYQYTGSSNHLKAVFKVGKTKNLTGSIVSRTIATFYKTARICGDTTPDPLGRVLAIEGPCEVSDTTATSCTDNLPRTELHYYATSVTSYWNAGRLEHVDQFTGDCSSKLRKTYDEYTALGDPAKVTDPNGVVTSFLYNAARQVTQRATTLGTTSYEWENGELKWVTYPQANKEFFCHRLGTDCDGAWTKNLMAQTKFASSCTTATCSSWSERIRYAYWDNSSDLRFVRRYTNAGGSEELRSEQAFEPNAEGRPTWAKVGDVVDAGISVRQFDGAGNLTELGPAFNGAPSFCRNGSAPSELCSWLRYDRANRLTEVDGFPTGAHASLTRSCFDHDSHGNIKRVSFGCDGGSSSACNFEGGSSSCSVAPNDYVHDDFGNIVEVKLADTDNDAGTAVGVSRFAHDAFGNVITEKKPMGQTVDSTYDALGRLLSVSESGFESFTLGYDSATGECSSIENTAGRLSVRTDAHGTTCYSYDVEGRVVLELLVPVDGSGPFTTEYEYSANGNLKKIVYPYGRTITYGYPASNGELADRVSSVSMTTYNGSSWTSAPGTDIITSVTWEPYGGLRSYVAQHTTTSTSSIVEHYLTGNAEVPPDGSAILACGDTAGSMGSGYDKSARLRGLRVTKSESSAAKGDLFKRLYTWRADQVVQMDTCYLDDDLPITEVSSYDKTLRLTQVQLPNQPTTGGWQGQQVFTYDMRGNKTNVVVDIYGSNYNLERSGIAHAPDWLTKENSGVLAHRFVSNANGTIVKRTTPNQQDTDIGGTLTFNARANGLYRSVEKVAGSQASVTWTYAYDAFNRRIRKEHPTGDADKFYYDTGHQLLVDLGLQAYTGTLSDSKYPVDEYVWLDGRPVAVVRAKFDKEMTRQADATGSCMRMGVAAACGTYFIVTDHIGKPVVTLDSSRRITGVGEYEPFGALNRMEFWAGTGWTYPATSGNYTFAVGQRAHGMMTAIRAHFTRFEAEQTCALGFKDGIQLKDNTTAASCQDMSGYLGEVWSNWCPVVQNTGGYGLMNINWHADVSGQNCDRGASCSTCPNPNAAYAGFTMRDYEYQRYQADAGASMYFPPLRFPGQYFDEETHLHENWNRFYDPVPGVYTSVEPKLGPIAVISPEMSYAGAMRPELRLALGLQGGPRFVGEQAQNGFSTPAYAYAGNNPIANIDPDGLTMTPGQMTNPPGPFQNNPPPGWGGPRPSSGTCGGAGAGAGSSVSPANVGQCVRMCIGTVGFMARACNQMYPPGPSRVACMAAVAAYGTACIAGCAGGGN